MTTLTLETVRKPCLLIWSNRGHQRGWGGRVWCSEEEASSSSAPPPQNHGGAVAPLTCRWAGTPPPGPGASWPSGCCGRSCPRRNTPPPWLWAGGPAASPAAGQSSALQRCSRFYLENESGPIRMAWTGEPGKSLSRRWLLPEWAMQIPSLAAMSLKASMPLSP